MKTLVMLDEQGGKLNIVETACFILFFLVILEAYPKTSLEIYFFLN